MESFAGQTALVTGASRGIGRAIAKALVAEGMQVVGTSRDPDSADWPAGVEGARLDASSAESVEQCWRQAGLDERRLDLVVNNAGAGVFGAFEERSFEDWERQVGLMLLGVMKLSHLALGKWSPENPGVLVNIGSLACEYPIPYMSGYNAAKAGLAAFCESLQLEADPAAALILELRLGDISTGFNNSVAGRPSGSRQNRVWKAMLAHVDSGPPPEFVAAKLVKCLARREEGLVRVGGFFQAIVAPLFRRLASRSLSLGVNRSYYNVS